MWLPDSFYERAPQYWLLLGLMLIIVGTYLGVQMQKPLFIYLGVGVGAVCCLWSFRIFNRRTHLRNKTKDLSHTQILTTTQKIEPPPESSEQA